MHLIYTLLSKYNCSAHSTINVLRLQCTKNAGNTVHCRILVVYPCDHVTDWKLGLAITTQHHQWLIILHFASLRKKQCVLLLCHHKVKKSEVGGHLHSYISKTKNNIASYEEATQSQCFNLISIGSGTNFS